MGGKQPQESRVAVYTRNIDAQTARNRIRGPWELSESRRGHLWFRRGVVNRAVADVVTHQVNTETAEKRGTLEVHADQC